jgi:MSHA biogenesis protein MshP
MMQWRQAGHTEGFSLVAVLFLIVVVAALGAFAVRIGAGQQQTVNLALLGARALSAANSGIEFGAYQALSTDSCASSNTTLNLSGAGLAGFAVAVTCTLTTHVDGSASGTNVYRIGSISTFGTYGQPDYVSREVYATFSEVLP